MDPHENNLFASWATTVLIGLLIGAGLGYVFSIGIVRTALHRVSILERIVYTVPEACMRWYHAPASQATTYAIVTWAIMMGLLALLTHAFRLRRDQSILDQLWH